MTERRFQLGELCAFTEAVLARAEGAFLSFLFGNQPAERHELRGSVAVVRVEGPLSHRACWWDNYDSIRSRFEQALADSAAKAVVLRINSPGGDTAGLFACVQAMRAAKVRAGKPVEAVADEQASSAAYALATVADRVVVPRAGAVGSIGVLSLLTDATNASDGVRRVLLRSGKRKGEGHPLAGLNDEVIARRQARVDELARQFAELVAQSRGGDAARWLALEGEEFLGEAAVRVGLADAIGSFDEVVQQMNDKSALATRAKALGLSDNASEEEVKAAEKAADAKKAADAAARQAAEELAAQARAESEAQVKAAATVDQLIAGGKLPPSKRESALSMYSKHGEAALQALADIVNAVPPALGAEHAPARGQTPTTHLSALDRQVCKQLGLDPEQYAQAKAAERAAEEE